MAIEPELVVLQILEIEFCCQPFSIIEATWCGESQARFVRGYPGFVSSDYANCSGKLFELGPQFASLHVWKEVRWKGKQQHRKDMNDATNHVLHICRYTMWTFRSRYGLNLPLWTTSWNSGYVRSPYCWQAVVGLLPLTVDWLLIDVKQRTHLHICLSETQQT